MKFFQLVPLLLVSLMPVLGHSPKGVNDSKIRCLESERLALLKFKDELVDTQGRLSSWSNEEHKRDCCKWRGVQCHNGTNHVIRLDLHSPLDLGDYDTDARLKGMISASLLELQNLQYLDLSFNDFGHAPIPDFVGSLSELRYLNLAFAKFGGPIPSHLGNLSRLLHLDLSHNDCYGKSLDWVSHLHSLKYLDFSYTNLSKETNWLQAISKLTSIKELHMYASALPDIPPSSLPSINASVPLAALDLGWNLFEVSTLALIRWFSNFSSTGLMSINLDYNSMPSPIPDVFQNMVSLSSLSLTGTGLEGGIPAYFGNMSSLTDLDLNWNNLAGEFFELMRNLSGPAEKTLQTLFLWGNSISGSLSNLSSFSSLEHLDLRENQLNGSIQEGYLKLPHLTSLYLSSNKLTGPLPDLSFSLSLEELFLQNNSFNGALDDSIRRLHKLETLWIGSNLFDEIITESVLSNLSRLQKLDLSLNPYLTLKFSPEWVPPFQLKYLSLRHCKSGPNFPLWLKTQKELIYIDISSTGIVDIIPSWFGGIAPKLQYMNASNNQMQGVFPDFSFSIVASYFWQIDLKRLDLSRNKISGSITFLCHASNWELLDLSTNLLSDQIPDCFTHFEWLKYLNLANNNFFGKIPHSFGSLGALSLLHLRNNSFSGELPTSMRNCTNLKMIDLGENRLTGNIPTWIGDKFSQLKVLVLRFNEFYGSIPPSLCSQNIQILDISCNKISGVIPDCVHKYVAMTVAGVENRSFIIDPHPVPSKMDDPIDPVAFQSQFKSLENAYFMWKGKEVKYANHLGLVKLIDLSSNNLGGEIPFNITQLIGLIGLNFSSNNMTGSIPHNIGKLRSLNFLDFSKNHLSGSIPTSLGKLTYLGVLNLSYNNLCGKIPQITQLLTFNETSYMGNPGLCGLPLNKSCPKDESHQDSGNNAISNTKNDDDGFISEGFYISLGLGFIVGFWGIVGSILLNKAVQYAFIKVLNNVEDFVYVKVEITKSHLLRHFRNG
ncbi:Leucine-rich repeat protein [Handroanthus impetiginosus]|uniref:Leucine-rich repeat protein n=1 Tax=Handroanthus impetiginosus TaxID=429701 RepID=A0A2G9GZ23_9LAMI|nr:Leucine-rich repeat protein [Handroanthus impetiginosus]